MNRCLKCGKELVSTADVNGICQECRNNDILSQTKVYLHNDLQDCFTYTGILPNSEICIDLEGLIKVTHNKLTDEELKNVVDYFMVMFK